MKCTLRKILTIAFVFVLMSTNISSLADYHEYLPDRNRPPVVNGISPYGNSVPTAVYDLSQGKYTASWNSVTSYTYTSKLFTAGSGKSFTLSLDVIMNEYGEKGHFYVHLCNAEGTPFQTVFNSGGTPKHSYQSSKTITVPSATKKYCFKFVVDENGGNSCSGDLIIKR